MGGSTERMNQIEFEADLTKFREMGGSVEYLRPCLSDKVPVYANDWQYVTMNNWAFKRIINRKPKEHYDVGSQVQFLLLLSNIVPVVHVDIRESGARGDNF